MLRLTRPRIQRLNYDQCFSGRRQFLQCLAKLCCILEAFIRVPFDSLDQETQGGWIQIGAIFAGVLAGTVQVTE